jgi:hypothetical protein
LFVRWQLKIDLEGNKPLNVNKLKSAKVKMPTSRIKGKLYYVKEITTAR